VIGDFSSGLPTALSIQWRGSVVQIVNGYLCMNCCDVDKARLGQDPHQSTDQIQKQIDRQLHPLAPHNFGPAVTLGGSLQRTASAQGGNDDGTRASSGTNPPQNAGAVAGSQLDLTV